jgi:hypothetical protein
MITADIFGGLGNQLFIVFATISFAISNSHNFYFLSIEKTGNRNTYWKTLFKNINPFLYADENAIFFEKKYLYNELGFRFAPINSPNVNEKNVLIRLKGYFQSYKYFSEYYSTICKLLKIHEQRREMLDKYRYIISEEELNNTVSIHFRIGDYLHQQHNHPVLKKDYYKNALSIIKIMKPSTDIVLYFCEKENHEQVERIVNELRTIFPMKFILADQTMEDWQQLLFMSCCANNIIANSTFSWWGAYLNTHSGKIVIYPETWFGPALSPTHDVSELCPPEWICIEE